MKGNCIFIIGIMLAVTACKDKNGEYDASGVFETTEVLVSAQQTGELLQFAVREGQELKANKPFGLIDTTQLHLRKLQLSARLKAAQSRQTDVARQIASLKEQIATQRKEQKRYENLVKANAANAKILDDIRAQIKVLEKQLAANEENLTNNNLSIKNESMGIRAQIAQIEDMIEKSIISSPIDGTVLAKYAEQGELAVQGHPLLKIGDIDNMILRVYITADQLTRLKINQSVKVYADWGSSERKEYRGKIIRISDKAEFTPKTIQTRDERANLVYAVKVAVKNDGYIKIGMYGEIKIDGEEAK